jgi:hypothetical protein
MKIEVWQGDITALAVDAIVNAANESLLAQPMPMHFRHGTYCTPSARSGTTASATNRHCWRTATGSRCSWPNR